MTNESTGIAASRLPALAIGVRRSPLFTGIGVGLCYSTTLVPTASPRINQAGWIDAYVYAGYTNDYSGLLQRFGPTYYSEPIAYIYYPAKAFTSLFGLEGGYFAFRLVALASAVAAIFAVGCVFMASRPRFLRQFG